MFLIWVPVLAFALYQSERTSTRIALVGFILLNVVGAGCAFVAGDGDRFAGFERAWRGDQAEPQAE